jgi:hypothetical protein
MAKRTTRNFEFARDVWPVVETWARERDFTERSRAGSRRRYQQGHGMMVAPKVVEVKRDGNRVEIQGFVTVGILNRIMTLAIMPGELDLGRGYMAMIPRSTARRDVDMLLQRLAQPPIKVGK